MLSKLKTKYDNCRFSLEKNVLAAKNGIAFNSTFASVVAFSLAFSMPTVFAEGEETTTKTPDAIISSMAYWAVDIIKQVALPFAIFYGMIGAIKYMSTNPQNSMAGVEQIKRAALGLVCVFSLTTLFTLLKTKASEWS